MQADKERKAQVERKTFMNIIYEYATENDAYGINYVAAHSWKETYTGLLPDDYLNNRITNIPNKTETTKEFLRTYNGTYIVAKDKGKVVGILAFSPAQEEKYQEYGHLEALYVLKQYQGLGIGKELFKKAVVGLKDMGYSKMQLECMCGNNSLNFYQKYSGIVKSQIDYPINHIGTVKADIVLFENLDEVFSLLSDNFKKRTNR